MADLIIAIGVIAIIILAWGKFNKAMDWTGDRIGDTTDLLKDLTESGTKQTARGLIISQDTLLDTAFESREKNAKRAKNRAAFESKLSENEKKSLETHDAWLDKLATR